MILWQQILETYDVAKVILLMDEVILIDKLLEVAFDYEVDYVYL